MLKAFLSRLIARIPQLLPHTPEELDRFTTETLEIFGLENNRNYQRAVATLIQHFGQDKYMVSKAEVYHAVIRAEAMRCCFLKLQALNKEEKPEAPQIPGN